MGFFKSLFKLFSNAIECPKKFAHELLYIPRTRRGRIKLNATLIVNEGSVAVLSTKGKACDVFVAGKHKLTLGAMPEVARLTNFHKKPKKGKKPRDWFRGEVYFVNTKVFGLGFIGFQSFWIKDMRIGRIKAKASGDFEFEISDAKRFISVCLLKWAYVKGEVVKRQLSAWMGYEVANVLEKQNLPLIDFAKNEEYISKDILPSISKKFLSYGFKVNSLTITDTSVPNKIAQVLYEEQEGLKEGENNYYEQEFSEFNKRVEALEQEETPIINAQGFYNNIEDYEEKNLNPYTYGRQHSSNWQESFNSATITMEKEDYEGLSAHLKTCKNCFTRIDQDAKACYNCGASQDKYKLCKNCKTSIEEGEFVCPNCRSIIIE